MRVMKRSQYRPDDEFLFVLGEGWKTYLASDDEDDDGKTPEEESSS